jgi:hypothetical protein
MSASLSQLIKAKEEQLPITTIFLPFENSRTPPDPASKSLARYNTFPARQ